MTHASQLNPDYFSHKPRSFLSHHSDFDGSIPKPSSPPRGRRPTRQVAYNQPALATLPPASRVPRSRTLVRLLVLLTVAGLVSLGWRCEAVGCNGRGGGAMVGEYVGGGSVVAGWAGREGVDFSRIWERPVWNGGEEEGEGVRDEEGELVGFVGDDADVDSDDEEAGGGEGDEQKDKAEERGVSELGEGVYELYSNPDGEVVDAETTDFTGHVADGAGDAVAEAVSAVLW